MFFSFRSLLVSKQKHPYPTLAKPKGNLFFASIAEFTIIFGMSVYIHQLFQSQKPRTKFISGFNCDFPREGKKRGRRKKIKKRIFGRIVKTIERELEEYASQTCTSWSGKRKRRLFTLIMPEVSF